MTFNLNRRPLSDVPAGNLRAPGRTISRRSIPSCADLATKASGNDPAFATLDMVVPQARLFHSLKGLGEAGYLRSPKQQEWDVIYAGERFGIRSQFYLSASDLRILLVFSALAHQNPRRTDKPFCLDSASDDREVESLDLARSWAMVSAKGSLILKMLGKTGGGKNYDHLHEGLVRLGLVQMARLRGRKTTWVPLLIGESDDRKRDFNVCFNPFIARRILCRTKDDKLWTRISLIEMRMFRKNDVATILCTFFSGSVGLGKSIQFRLDELQSVVYPDRYVTQNTINERNGNVRAALNFIRKHVGSVWNIQEPKRGSFVVSRASYEDTLRWEERMLSEGCLDVD